jgi:acyl-CoA-binding protein
MKTNNSLLRSYISEEQSHETGSNESELVQLDIQARDSWTAWFRLKTTAAATAC